MKKAATKRNRTKGDSLISNLFPGARSFAKIGLRMKSAPRHPEPIPLWELGRRYGIRRCGLCRASEFPVVGAEFQGPEARRNAPTHADFERLIPPIPQTCVFAPMEANFRE